MTLTALNIIGDPGNHDQHAHLIVTGKMDYAGDRLPGRKLYGAIKASTIAHGSVKNINSARALAEPGVKAIVTYKEVAIWNQSIFQWGQEVAGVVADDWHTAVRATTMIDVTYNTAAAVFDPDKAMKAGAPLTGVRPDSNVETSTKLTRGEGGQAGLAGADVFIEAIQPWSTTYQHNTIETHNAVAWWIGDDVYAWSGSQQVFSGRSALANALGMPLNKVHFFSHGTGCGHGDKTAAGAAIVAVFMSKAVNGTAVHVIQSRHDNMLFNTRQFSLRSNIKLGSRKDGTLTGIDAQFWADCGRNPLAPAVNAHFGLRTTYTCPDASFAVTRVVTNTPQRGFWRCVNDPPGAVNYDAALDKLADKLGMDPYTLRMKNLSAADSPDQDPPNMVWGGLGIKECFMTVYTNSNYAQKWHKPGQKILPDGRLHGIAITGHIDSHGSVNGSNRGGIITITADGKCLVNLGGARGCEGGPTVCAHIVAEALGMKYEDVRCCEWGNTDVSIDAGIQAGSGFTGGAGSAFYNAAIDARARLFAAAITKPGLKEIPRISADQLDAKNSEVFVKSDPTKKLTYRQVMSGTPPIAGYGVGWPPNLMWKSVGGQPLGTICNTNGSAASCAEIAVDPETGEVEVLGYWNAVDTGRTIFKQGTTKEMLSGCELQIHQALFAGDVYDMPSGACISSHFTESLVPTAMDMKGERFNVYDIESDDAAGPYGAHGIGEPCVTNYSAIICAIFNATGRWADPEKAAYTPDKILKALGKT